MEELPNLEQSPDPAELLERIRERKRRTQSVIGVDQILQHQDEDRP